jgi:hypothetical protein
MAEKKEKSKPASVAKKRPKGPKLIKEARAHFLVARTAASMGPAEYICVPSVDGCLRFGRDPKTGDYSIPPYGELMDCATCRSGGRAA